MLVDTLDAIAAGMEAVEKAEKAEQTADSPPLRLAQRLPAMVPYRRVTWRDRLRRIVHEATK
jgi:hypothetical protein